MHEDNFVPSQFNTKTSHWLDKSISVLCNYLIAPGRLGFIFRSTVYCARADLQPTCTWCNNGDCCKTQGHSYYTPAVSVTPRPGNTRSISIYKHSAASHIKVSTRGRGRGICFKQSSESRKCKGAHILNSFALSCSVGLAIIRSFLEKIMLQTNGCGCKHKNCWLKAFICLSLQVLPGVLLRS